MVISMSTCNSRPSFTDISHETLGICPDILEENLYKEKNIKAVVPVHFGGLAYNSKKIYEISIQDTSNNSS